MSSGVERTHVAQEGDDVGIGHVEALGDNVDLGAPARAEHGGLTDVVALGETHDRLAEIVAGDRQPFQGWPEDPCGGSHR